LKKNWTPEVQFWLKTKAGQGNYQYRKPQDAFVYLQYAFSKEEDALAFKIKFGF